MKKPTTDPLLAVAYLRVSTEQQDLGPEAQLTAIHRWCAANKVELVSTHSDIGVSGAVTIDDRPGLMGALASLVSTRAGILLVAKRDRLARDVVISSVLERMVEKEGARICSADGTANDEGAEGSLMRHILAAFAEYERQLIRSRTKAALAVKRSRGERCSGQIPFGHTLGPDGIHLLANEGEQATIKVARALREQSYSFRQIAEALTDAGHKPRKGRTWQPMQVKRMTG